jgi:hypothetical protein
MAFLLKKCFGRGVPPLGPLEKPLLRQRWGHNFRNRWGHNFSCVPIPLRSFQTGTGLKLLSPRPTPKQGKALQLPLPKRSRGHDFSRVPMPLDLKIFNLILIYHLFLILRIGVLHLNFFLIQSSVTWGEDLRGFRIPPHGPLPKAPPFPPPHKRILRGWRRRSSLSSSKLYDCFILLVLSS